MTQRLVQRDAPTKSAINRAGGVLRATESGDDISFDEVRAALEVLRQFRAAHATPLTKANMGLRSMVATEGCRLEISQRLKRMPTIIDKLVRYPAMKLSTMQDIGGCRAILDSVDEVRRVQRRLSKNRPPIRVNDYLNEPKPSGYRSVHVIVDYDGRSIEVQLRTQVMHDWAVAVERLGGRLQADLKSSIGPPPVLRFLEAIAEAMALEEAGQAVDTVLMDRLARLREDALPFLGGPR